jgi:hypothetical protein
MAELKTDALLKSVEAFRAEKEAVTTKEKELIEGLNAALSKIGYRVGSYGFRSEATRPATRKYCRHWQWPAAETAPWTTAGKR